MSVDVFRRIRLRESVSALQQQTSPTSAFAWTSLLCLCCFVFGDFVVTTLRYPVIKLSKGFPLCSAYFEHQMDTNISLFRPYLGDISSGFINMASRYDAAICLLFIY